MEQLIKVVQRENVLVVSSSDVSKYLGTQHKSLLETIRNYQPEIEAAFGRVAFETAPLKTKGGVQKTSVAYLNEGQSIFVSTLSRNTDQVVKFKIQLVQAFQAAKEVVEKVVATTPDPFFKHYHQILKENDLLKARLARNLEITRAKNDQIKHLQQYGPQRYAKLPTLAEIKQNVLRLPSIPTVPQTPQVIPITTPQSELLNRLLGQRWTSKLTQSTGLTPKALRRIVNQMDTSHECWPQILELAKRNKEAINQTSDLLSITPTNVLQDINQLPY